MKQKHEERRGLKGRGWMYQEINKEQKKKRWHNEMNEYSMNEIGNLNDTNHFSRGHAVQTDRSEEDSFQKEPLTYIELVQWRKQFVLNKSKSQTNKN